MHAITAQITTSFKTYSNPQRAAQQEAYMRHLSKFVGLGSKERRELLHPFLTKSTLPNKKEAETIVKELWQQPEREFQYAAQELYEKYKKEFDPRDIDLFEWMILNKSWWDTIDFIAPKLAGVLFKKHPEIIDSTIDKWLNSGNIWLQRACILYQLKYKNKMDTNRLEFIIQRLLGSKEFFINKAIGWILREYSKTNPEWVAAFIKKNESQLAPLSIREGSKYLYS